MKLLLIGFLVLGSLMARGVQAQVLSAPLNSTPNMTTSSTNTKASQTSNMQSGISRSALQPSRTLKNDEVFISSVSSDPNVAPTGVIAKVRTQAIQSKTKLNTAIQKSDLSDPENGNSSSTLK